MTVAPHTVDQLVLGHDPVPVLDQVDEQVERLRLEVDRGAVADQLATVHIEYAPPESVHARSLSGPARLVSATCPRSAAV